MVKIFSKLLRRKKEKSEEPSEILREFIEEETKAVIKPRTFKIPPGFKEVEAYPLYEPWAWARILQDPDTGETVYWLDEIPLTSSEKGIYDKIMEILYWELKPPPSEEHHLEYFKKEAKRIVMEYRIRLGRTPGVSWSKILYYVERDAIGFGAIDPLMRDQNIEDISCDGVGRPVYVWHRRYEYIPTNIVFNTEAELDALVVKLAHKAGKHISVAFPIVDAILPGGHRLAATFRREVSTSGSTFTIRKFREDPITIVDMIKWRTLSPELAAYLWMLIEHKKTGLILGITGSGKTSTLNALATLFRPTIKVVTIEDTPELRLPLENWVQLVARPSYGIGPQKIGEITLYDLIKVSLRYRPDVIIVGEVRGEEAYVLFQAIASVSHDTPILIRDAEGEVKLMAIGEFVDRFYSEGEEGIAKPVRGYEVLSNDGFNVVWKPVKYVLRHRAEEIYEIEYEGGGKVEATGSHSVFVLDPYTLEIFEKPVRFLKPGDLLITFVNRGGNGESYKYIDVISLVKDKNGVYVDSLPQEIKRLTKGRNPIPLQEYVDIERKIGNDRAVVRDNIVIRLKRSRGAIPARLVVDEDLAFVFGAYLADGCIKDHKGKKICFTFGKSEEEVSRKVISIMHKKFGIKPSIDDRGTYAICEYHHTLLAEIFERLLGRSLREKRIPSVLWSSPKSVIRSFFEGLKANSRRTLRRRYVSYVTANRGLAYQLLWLARIAGFYSELTVERGSGKNRGRTYYGIMVYLNENYRKPNASERIPTAPILRLIDMAKPKSMPWYLTYIRKRKFISKKKAKEVLDWIEREGNLDVLCRRYLAKIYELINGDIFVVEVKSVRRKPYSGYVYDISVPQTESFMGGALPLLLHNTGHGGLCLPGDQLVLAKVNGIVDLYEIRDIVEGVIGGSVKDVEVLAYKEGKAKWVAVKRAIVKTGSNKFIRIYVENGVMHEVHENHPVVIYEGGKLVTKPAKELKEGDILASIATLPVAGELRELDVLKLLEKYSAKLYIEGAGGFLRKVPHRIVALAAASIGRSPTVIDDWKYRRVAVPYRALRRLGLGAKHSELRVRYGEKGQSSIPVRIKLSRDFGFIIGAFLGDGSMCYDDKDNLPRRVTFYVGRDAVLAEELIKALESVGVSRDSIKVRVFNKDTYGVVVESKIFALMLYEVLHGKVTDYDRSVPLDVALRSPKEFREGIVKGYWMTEGSTFKDGRGCLRIYAQAVNRKLAESMALLLKTLGIYATVTVTDNSCGFGKGSNSVAYVIVISGGESKRRMAKILGIRLPHRTYSRVREVEGLCLHRVRRVDIVEKDTLLYDIEVPDGHIYAVSGGLVLTHNTTMHAEYIDAAVKRLTSPPMNIPENYIPLIDFALVIRRVTMFKPDGTYYIARKISEVWEVRDYNEYITISKWNPAKDEFEIDVNRSELLNNIAEYRGKDAEWIRDEIIRRAIVLKWMSAKDIRYYKDIAGIVHKYYAKPEEIYKRALYELKSLKGIGVHYGEEG